MNGGPATSANVIDQGAGRCALAGDLTLATADRLWNQLHATGLLRTASHVDASQLAKSDSAGLALLVAWRAVRRKDGGDLAITSLPGRLTALARLTDAEDIVSG
jgi:phospholipid transport system transporter-binding protein